VTFVFFRRQVRPPQKTYEIEGLLDEAELLERLQRRFSDRSYRPPMPPAVAMELHAVSKRQDASVPEVVTLLESDPMLAADVLRVAQSPMYASRIAPRTIGDAVLRLGLDGLTNLVWQVATGRIFRAKGFEQPMEAIRRHSVAVAHATRLVASRTGVAEEHAFLFGLLHDVGYVAMVHEVAAMRREGATVDLESNAAAVHSIHEDAGAKVAKLWKLAPDLCVAIASHGSPTIDGYAHPLVSALVLAEHVAYEIGFGVTFGDTHVEAPSGAAVETARRTLAVDAPQLSRLRDAISEKLEKL